METFIVDSIIIKNRLDPLYYFQDTFFFLKNCSFDIKNLGEVTSNLKAGFPAGASARESDEEGIIQIRPTNIDEEGLLKFDKNIYIKEKIRKQDDFLQKGEVLFNNTNSQELVGKTAFFDLDGKYFCSNHITRIKVNERIILPEYLWILLNIYQNKKVFYNICTNWNNQSGVNVDLLRTVKIPLPPLETQNRIVSIMQSAYEKKKQKEQEAEKLLSSIDDYVSKELGVEFSRIKEKKCFSVYLSDLKGILSPLFFISTPKNVKNFIKLKEIAKINPYREKPDLSLEDNVPYIGLPETDDQEIKKIKIRKYIEVKGRNIIKQGDILFARIEPSIFNKKYIFANDLKGKDYAFTSTEFYIVEPNQKINSEFLFYMFFIPLVFNQVIGKTTGSTGRRRLDKEVFENLLIPFPSLNSQNKIAEQVKNRMTKVKELKIDANNLIDKAKKEVEEIILGANQ